MSSIARLSAFPHVAREIMQQFKTEPVHLIGLTGTNSRGTSPLRHDRLTPSSFSKQAAQRNPSMPVLRGFKQLSAKLQACHAYP